MKQINRIQELLIEKAAGTISETDNAYINKLIEENKDVQLLWEDINTFYNTSGKVSAEQLDESAAWNKIKDKIVPQRSKRIKFTAAQKWIAAASVFLLAAIISFTLYKQHKNKNDYAAIKKLPAPAEPESSSHQIQLKLGSGEKINLSNNAANTINTSAAKLNTAQNSLSFKPVNTNVIEWNTLEVPAQLDYKITLSDGTEIWLNSTSSLRFPFNFPAKSREVFIEGEAYLKVAKNADKPFIVHTAETDIMVHGTSFNVNTYTPSQTIVSLVEGLVSASGKNDETIQLTPGYEAAIFKNNSYKVKQFNKNDVLGWMNGIQYFHEASLKDISQIIYRWFDTKVIFDDPGTANYTFTGVIKKNKPLPDFLNNLKASSGISFSYNNGVLHIK